MSQNFQEGTITQITFPVGHKVRLRPFDIGDAEICMSWMNNSQVSQFIRYTGLISLAQERKWLEELPFRKDAITFGITDLDTGRLIGSIGLHDIYHRNQTAETGTVIGDPALWGGGYGTDAKMLLLQYAFEELNLRKIRSRVYDFNGRSLAYAAKCGYREEGRLVQEHWKGGQYIDVVLLAVFRDAWRPLWEQYRIVGSAK